MRLTDPEDGEKPHGRKLMKPFGELNRRLRPELVWVLLGGLGIEA